MDKIDVRTLADNSQVRDRALADLCWELQKRVSGGGVSLADLLERPGQRESGPLEIFRRGEDGSIWTGNLAGIFEYRRDGRTTRVVIGSRFDPKTGPGAAPDGGMGLFVQAMLETCWNIPLSFLEEFRGRQGNAPYDLLLTLRLALQLERAWKHGQLRTYRSRPLYDSRVKGRLDLPRQIRQSMGLSDGRAAYVVREYSGDNDYSRLFLQALLDAERRHPDFLRRVRQERPQFRLACRDLLQQASGWEREDRRTLLARTKKRIVNPIYREHEALRVVSRAVLRRMGGHQPQERDAAPFVTGVFLDISQLWEWYLIEGVFKRTRLGPPSSQAQSPVLEGALNIRPDFQWPGQGIVLDAKYRPIWDRADRAAPWPEEVREDVYQVLSYMLALDCAHGGVIFPTAGQDRPPEARRVTPGASRREFWLFRFAVPGGEAGRASFLQGMDAEADRLAGSMAENLAV